METEAPRLRGITLVGLLMWAVVALFVLRIGVLLLGSGTSEASKTPPMGPVKYEFAATWLLWAIVIGALAVGLERRKPWAWDGTVLMGSLAFGACLLILALGIALPTVNISEGVNTAAFGFVGIIPAIASLWYLLLAKTRLAFRVELKERPGQPNVWVRLLASQSILSSTVYFGEVFKTTSTLVLGVSISGAFQVMYALTLGAMSAYGVIDFTR